MEELVVLSIETTVVWEIADFSVEVDELVAWDFISDVDCVPCVVPCDGDSKPDDETVLFEEDSELDEFVCDVDKIPLEGVKLAVVIEETVAFRLMLAKIVEVFATIELELGEVVVDRFVEPVAGDLGAGKTDVVFPVLEPLEDAVVDNEDGLDPVVVEEEEAWIQSTEMPRTREKNTAATFAFMLAEKW